MLQKQITTNTQAVWLSLSEKVNEDYEEQCGYY